MHEPSEEVERRKERAHRLGDVRVASPVRSIAQAEIESPGAALPAMLRPAAAPMIAGRQTVRSEAV